MSKAKTAVPRTGSGNRSKVAAPRLVLARKEDGAISDDGRVYGTWDFKWPLALPEKRAKIRVAFQLLPEPLATDLAKFTLPASDFLPPGKSLWSDAEPFFITGEPKKEAPRARFTDDERTRYGLDKLSGFELIAKMAECIANRWFDGVAETARIRLDFDKANRLPAPLAMYHDDGSGRDIQASRSELEEGHAARDYDVLVSLCDLPVLTRRERLAADNSNIPVDVEQFLPGSELGSYAQRIDYGVPTTYLGKRERFPGLSTQYLLSHEFVHWVLHEFGHVLGLAHEQQNPNISDRIKSVSNNPLQDEEARIAKVLSQALGYDPKDSPITEDEIESEISTPWPVVKDAGGTILYSDFRAYAPGSECDDGQSVMFHVYWQRILGKEGAEPKLYFRPHKRDADQLKGMYGI